MTARNANSVDHAENNILAARKNLWVSFSLYKYRFPFQPIFTPKMLPLWCIQYRSTPCFIKNTLMVGRDTGRKFISPARACFINGICHQMVAGRQTIPYQGMATFTFPTFDGGNDLKQRRRTYCRRTQTGTCSTTFAATHYEFAGNREPSKTRLYCSEVV